MKDGRAYVAESSVVSENVVGLKRFNIAVAGLVHGHVHGMIKGLCDAGAKVVCVYDSSDKNIEDFLLKYGSCDVLNNPEDIISSSSVDLVINCMMPDIRADFSVRCIESGKAVFSDKPGFLTREDGLRIEQAVKTFKGRYCIYFSEHFHHEGSICAERIIKSGRIGKVFSYIGMGPHRLNEPSRPSWFFNPKINGDVIVDLGCHLIEQFLLYTGNNNAKIVCSHKANIEHLNHPSFFDCGDVSVVGDNGATGYIKVDWFTSDGIPSWGDCRTFVYGTKGELEVRKYCDIANSDQSDNVYVADNKKCEVIKAHNSIGFDFFGEFISDCLNKDRDCSIEVNGVSLPVFCIRAMSLSIEASEKAEH